MTTPTLTLSVNSLCSKWGFNDGDEPEHLLDYWDDTGVDHYNKVAWHSALRKLVRSHLVPAIEAAGHTVEVYDVDTIHNPIRASAIDGVEVDDFNNCAAPVPMRIDHVTVPYEAIVEACGLVET